MFRFLYSTVFYLLTPFLLFRLWRRGAKAPAYRQRIAERFGFASVTRDTAALWVHAVSVGECVAITPVINQLLSKHPQLEILVTTSTPTGAARVAQLFAAQPRVWHQYCPYDQPSSVKRFLSTHRPMGLVIVETELWPNMLAQCAALHLPTLLVNARLSAKSQRGYAKLTQLTKSMLQDIDLIVAQQDEDLERFVELGINREKVLVNGSIKFDLNIAQDLSTRAATLKERIGQRPVVILGSCHESEERGLFEQMELLWQQFPGLLLIVVPRHPERFDEVAQLAQQFSSKVLRRSEADVDQQCQVYIGDTMGELLLMYAVADLAVVGGSFVPRGGQNPIEPAALNKAVLMGPHRYNFAKVCQQLATVGGLTCCDDYQSLAANLVVLLSDAEKKRLSGDAAHRYYQSQRGASERLVTLIEQRCIAPR